MKYSKTKGNTMLELLVYISIGILILSISMSIYISTCKVYTNYVQKNLILNEIQEVYINIENIVKDKDVEKIRVLGNSIYVYINKEVNNLIKVITQYGDTIRIKYYYEETNGSYQTYSAPNSLMTGIKQFNVVKKNKLIYISIEKGGKIYKKCL